MIWKIDIVLMMTLFSHLAAVFIACCTWQTFLITTDTKTSWCHVMMTLSHFLMTSQLILKILFGTHYRYLLNWSSIARLNCSLDSRGLISIVIEYQWYFWLHPVHSRFLWNFEDKNGFGLLLQRITLLQLCRAQIAHFLVISLNWIIPERAIMGTS